MSSDESHDSDGKDHSVLISPRRRQADLGLPGKQARPWLDSHYDDLTNSLYSFTYSRTTGSLLFTRLSAMQRNVDATEKGLPAQSLPDIGSLLRLLTHSGSDPSAPVMSPKETEITDEMLGFLAQPYIDIVDENENENLRESQRPPSMFRRASSMIMTPGSVAVRGISTPLEHLPSKSYTAQAVLTTEAEYPFRIRMLNDIACLVFVTSQQTSANKSLLDFVTPKFRDWLINKIEDALAGRVKLSGELVEFVIIDEPKVLSLWVEKVSSDRLVWTLQEVSVRYASPTTHLSAKSQTTTAADYGGGGEPSMVHGITDARTIILTTPLLKCEPTAVGCAVALDRNSLVIRGYNRPTMYFMLGYRFDDLIGKHFSDLIPQFTDFWPHVKPLCTSVGVVIPEHRFRELAGLDPHSPEFVSGHPSNDPEKSIRARDKSGESIYVDIQLRLVDPTTFVLWISYSLVHAPSDVDKTMLDGASQSMLFPAAASNLGPTPSTSSTSSTGSVSDEDRSDTTESRSKRIAHRAGIRSGIPVPVENRSGAECLAAADPLQTAFVRDEGLSDSKTSPEESGEDDAWAKLSKIQVGARRRSIKIDDFDVLKVLGEGAYGKVSLVRPKSNKWDFLALKSIYKERILVDTWSRDRKLGTIPNEIRILNQLRATRHPHIVEMVDFFEDPECYHVEMLPIGVPQGEDLFDFIERQAANTDQSKLLNIWGQVVSAVAHVHSLGIVHRDIKDENIVMDQNGNAKLIDFGSAAYLKQGPFDVFVGTLDYAAPEVVQGQTYEGPPQDCWALGILLYTMMYKETPFHGIESIIEGSLPEHLDCLGSPLIRRLLVKNLSSRPTALRCLEYLTDMETDKA